MLGVTSIAVIAVTAVLAAASAYLLPRLLAPILAILVWPVYFLGLVQEWWGHGVGDGWEISLVALTAAAVLGSGIGVLARRAREGMTAAHSDMRPRRHQSTTS